jgi:superfamily II DNA or RNA helicase
LPEHRYLFIDDKELNNLRKATKDKDYNLLIPEFYTQTSNPTIIVATYETMLILLTEIPGLMAIYSVGFTAFDEAHRIPTESFLPVLEKLRSRKRVGLTATLRRSDSNIAPLIYHLGATVLTMKQTVDDFAMYINCRTPYTYSTLVNKKKLPTGTTIETWRDFLTAGDELRFLDYGETPSCFYVTYDSKIFDSDSKRKEFRYLKATQGKPVSTALEESFLSEYPKRLKTTVSIINKCLKVGRKILVLSSRLYNLKKLHAYYTLIGVPSALVIGGSDIDNDQEEYYLNNVAKIIFGSNALAKEGLDVESLDTVVTTTPLVDTEQAVGRTTRTFPGKKKPLYIAITDSTSYSYGITRKSLDFLEINTHKAHTPKSVDLKQALQLIETIK